MLKKSIIFLCTISFIFPASRSVAQNITGNKKLIEFGWDHPYISYLVKNITKVEKAPFDGVFFSFDRDVFHAFDAEELDDKAFQYDELKKIRWNKFTDNFIFVRGISTKGGHWLDDKSWEIIVKNVTRLSKAVSISRAKGIGFDAEYYYKDQDMNPWIYKPSLYNNLTYQEVGAFVRKRGKQFMLALQSNKTDIKILCFWLLGLVIEQHKTKALPETGMALLPFFVEGLLDGKNAKSEIIDGNETAYWYSKPEDFILSGEQLRNEGAKLLNPEFQEKYKSVSLAQSVYLDGLYAMDSMAERGLDKPTKQRWLRDNLYHAYKTTDKYIWFYNERVNWWENKIDPGITAIINDTRKKITAEENAGKYKTAGQSRVFDVMEKAPAQIKTFTYDYSPATNSIRIKSISRDIKKIQLFQNARLIYTVIKPAIGLDISLKKIYNGKGSLIVMASDQHGKAFVSYVN